MEHDVFDVLCPNCGQTKFGVLLKPDTLTRIKCPKCKNTTYVYVSENLDILTFDESELCDECNGSGKCSKCNGTGEVLCPKCKGDGWLILVDKKLVRLEELEGLKNDGYDHSFTITGCPNCGGAGSKYIDFCEMYDFGRKFSEKVSQKDIERIKGTGRVKCEKCGGTGVCPKCKGLKFIPKS